MFTSQKRYSAAAGFVTVGLNSPGWKPTSVKKTQGDIRSAARQPHAHSGSSGVERFVSVLSVAR